MKGVRNNFIVKCVLLIVVIAVGVIGLYYTVINNKSDEAMEEDYPKTRYLPPKILRNYTRLLRMKF